MNLYWINKESGTKPFNRQSVKSSSRQLITQFESLATIPGVGVKRAKFIFAMYPSIEDVIKNKHGLSQIDNIGKKTQEAIVLWATETIKVELPDK